MRRRRMAAHPGRRDEEVAQRAARLGCSSAQHPSSEATASASNAAWTVSSAWTRNARPAVGSLPKTLAITSCSSQRSVSRAFLPFGVSTTVTMRESSVAASATRTSRARAGRCSGSWSRGPRARRPRAHSSMGPEPPRWSAGSRTARESELHSKSRSTEAWRHGERRSTAPSRTCLASSSPSILTRRGQGAPPHVTAQGHLISSCRSDPDLFDEPIGKRHGTPPGQAVRAA